MPLPVSPLLLVALAAGLLGATAAVLSLRSLQRRRVTAGGGWFVVGIVFAMLAGAASLLAFGTVGYRNLTHETSAATVTFQRTGPDRFVATLERPGDEPRIFEVAGDAFVVEAQILKWHPAAAALGLRTGYALERLTSRYDAVADERSRPRTVVDLDTDRRVDAFDAIRRWPQLAPWVDATYGSGTYAPMLDGARYDVRVSTSGLLLRPLRP